MQRKWYQKKRFWLLITMLVLLWGSSQMEFLRIRYQPAELSKELGKSSSLPVTFQQKKVEGATMHYCQVGSGEHLPVIVLVHGSPGALSAYKDYLKDTLLQEQAILIAVDRLGFGYSDFGKAVPSLRLQARLIAAILADFSTSKKIIVGHSMGGPVNSRLAMDYPDMVDGMVLIAPSISPDLEPSNGWRKVLDFPLFRWFTPPAFRVCNQEILPLKEELVAMEKGWGSITCPVTIIQGTADKLVPAGNAYFAQERLVNSSAVELKMIEEGDHFILWSELPLIRKAILDMIKSVGK